MDQHVDLKTAQIFKKLGFKERVLTYFENETLKLHTEVTGWDFNSSFLTHTSRPTVSEALKWLAEEKGFYHYIEPIWRDSKRRYEYCTTTNDTIDKDEEFNEDKIVTTIEEAEQECLKELVVFLEKSHAV